MDAAALDRVYEVFQDFHDYCAPVFGRKQWRERSGQYLQALLVQSQERRNAENLSETVTASPRVLQRFLTEARWDDDAVIGRLQEYLCSRLEHPQAVWVLDGSDFPKQEWPGSWEPQLPGWGVSGPRGSAGVDKPFRQYSVVGVPTGGSTKALGGHLSAQIVAGQREGLASAGMPGRI